VDTSSRTQITRFGTAPESRPGDQVAAPNGGSACGYQPDFALSALQETADVRVADPYIYAPALAGRLSAHAADRVERRRPAGPWPYHVVDLVRVGADGSLHWLRVWPTSEEHSSRRA
jgi:hypothetical protein